MESWESVIGGWEERRSFHNEILNTDLTMGNLFFFLKLEESLVFLSSISVLYGISVDGEAYTSADVSL